jgi:hypothetical protein
MDDSSDEEAERPHGVVVGLALGVAWIVGGLAALFAAMYVLILGADNIWKPLGDSDAAIGAEVGFAAVTAGIGYGAWLIFDRTNADAKDLRRLAGGMVVAAITLGFGVFLIDDERRSADRIVSDYCSYGAVSEAQLEGCKSHVSYRYVESSNTPAAQFAKGGSSEAECGSSSGPFCQRVLNYRYLDEQQTP